MTKNNQEQGSEEFEIFGKESEKNQIQFQIVVCIHQTLETRKWQKKRFASQSDAILFLVMNFTEAPIEGCNLQLTNVETEDPNWDSQFGSHYHWILVVENN